MAIAWFGYSIWFRNPHACVCADSIRRLIVRARGWEGWLLISRVVHVPGRRTWWPYWRRSSRSRSQGPHLRSPSSSACAARSRGQPTRPAARPRGSGPRGRRCNSSGTLRKPSWSGVERQQRRWCRYLPRGHCTLTLLVPESWVDAIGAGRLCSVRI